MIKQIMMLKSLGRNDNSDNIYDLANYILDEKGILDSQLPSEIHYYCRCQQIRGFSSEAVHRRLLNRETSERARAKSLDNIVKMWAGRTSK